MNYFSRFALFGMLFSVTFLSCQEKTREVLLQGTWEYQSSVDVKTGKIIKSKDSLSMYALFSPDSLILFDPESSLNRQEVYSWKFFEDRLYVIQNDGVDSFFVDVKKLNKKNLIVEVSIFGQVRLDFKKVNFKSENK